MQGQTNSIRRTKTKRDGFTYVDAVITVFIMGIAAAIATPRLSTAYAQHQLRSATARLAADLAYLQQQAITKGRSLPVTIDTTSQTVECPQVPAVEQTNKSFSYALTEFVEGSKLSVVQLRAGNKSKPTKYDFSFSRDGLTLDQDGKRVPQWQIRIQLANSAGTVKATDEGVTWSVTHD